MAAGLIVRTGQGVIAVGVNDKLTKTLGRVDIPAMNAIRSGSGNNTRYTAPSAANGSIVVPQFARGRPFFFFVPNGQEGFYQFIGPSVTIDGTTLSWVWQPGAVDAKTKVENMRYGANTAPNTVGGVSIIYGAY